MMKKYNIIEVLNSAIGTQFKDECGVMWAVITKNNYKYLVANDDYTTLKLNSAVINMKFEKVIKVEHKPSIPLSSFKDVLLFVKENPKTKVKVEHKKLDNVIDELLIEKEKKLLDKPRTLDYLIFKLGQWFREPSDLAEIFLNGKWYVEG
ncbi:MAG: hypothetical protein ACLR02_09995 [Clostridium sp.]